MEPQYLLIQQIKANAEAIEQNLRCMYDSQIPREQKSVVLHYLYIQARQVNELVESLFRQFRDLRY